MRVVVADDAALLREGLSRLLAEAGFDVVGSAGNAETLLALVSDLCPDVAIVDSRMPPTFTDEGLRAALRIRTAHPDTGVLLLSQHVRATYAVELFGAEPRGVGYLLKERVADVDELTTALREVASGGCVLDADVATLLAGRHHLTDRENDVLGLMAQGRSNQAIGHHLGIAERTVEKHIAALFAKLGIEATPDDHRRVLAVLTYLGG
jgi:DNA-binding NarL/FixJ family response regulator